MSSLRVRMERGRRTRITQNPASRRRPQNPSAGRRGERASRSETHLTRPSNAAGRAMVSLTDTARQILTLRTSLTRSRSPTSAALQEESERAGGGCCTKRAFYCPAVVWQVNRPQKPALQFINLQSIQPVLRPPDWYPKTLQNFQPRRRRLLPRSDDLQRFLRPVSRVRLVLLVQIDHRGGVPGV